MGGERMARPVTPQPIQGLAGQFITTVSLVVTMTEDGPLITTAGSVVAASWDPPLLAVLFQTGSRMDVALDHCERFTVNVLAEADHGLARRFARPDREQGWAALDGVGFLRRDPSPPVLAGAVAWADCAVVQTIPIGDHSCFVGEVLESARRDGEAPLAYYRGRFRALGTSVAPAAWTAVEAADLTAVW
jgi:flavin reductase (DIM6/NTAB) family NADH-FMN oxidoreductase RutF